MPPRKRTTPTARKTTAPRKVVAAPPAVDPDAFDLASIFATDHLEPLPITLLGVNGHVRRYYTGEEVIRFSILASNLTQADGLLELLDLVTDVGAELWGKIGPLTPQHAARVLNKIIEMTGLHEGKLFAPLVSSPPPRAGAAASQASGATIS